MGKGKLHHLPGVWPYLLAMFINAFVDLGHKIVIQNTVFKLYDGPLQVVLTALVNGLMLLPFILLFSPAGHVSDRCSRVRVMRGSAWVAVGLTLVITLAYYSGCFGLAFAMTLLLAVQATFYSPAKYGHIRSLFGQSHLAEGNGLVQAVSIVAILAGTFVFTALFEQRFTELADTPDALLQQMAPLGWLLVLCSLLEVALLYRLPDAARPAPGQQAGWRQYFRSEVGQTGRQILRERPVIRQAIIGLAMFWSVGQVLLAAFPAYGKAQLGISNALVIQGILASSGFGIALGSALASVWSRNRIETGLIPVGALGIALGLLLLPWLASPWLAALDFVLIGLMGGLFIVPLNALVQFQSMDHELGSVLAVSNWVQNLAMLGFLLLTALLALAGGHSLFLLLLVAGVALAGGLYTVIRLPQSLMRFMLAQLMLRHYRVEVCGLQNLPATGGVLLLGNHISWVDWAMLQIACPRPVRFVMLRSIYERWYLHWLLKAMGCIPISQGASASQSLDQVAALLDAGEVVCLFPEGSISRTGQLGIFRKGFERACQRVRGDVRIVPFYLHGLWGSQFSRSSRQLKALRDSAGRRPVIVAFGPVLPKTAVAAEVKQQVMAQGMQAWQHYARELPTLADAWISAVRRRPGKKALADGAGPSIRAGQALAGSIALARHMRRISPEPRLGLLLPTSSSGMLASMAVLLAGKTLVNLNYTAGPEALQSALALAEIRTVYTSAAFLASLEQRGLPVRRLLQDCQVVYLEALQPARRPVEQLGLRLAIRLLPGWLLRRLFSRSHQGEATAVILFSSGSEGEPKGVQLSHRNLMANLHQIADVRNPGHKDVVMASLPLFHAFGLTATQFLPLVEGLPVICHPDPADVLGIARAVAVHRVTFICATSTLLRLFIRNRKVEPLMLDSLQIVAAGAERLDPEVREGFLLRFGKTLYEGYGATETASVVAVNLPDALDVNYLQVQHGSRPGTVGLPLPGTLLEIVDPETLAPLATGEDGMILVAGPQIMQGYLHDPQQTARVIREIDGVRWYVTGDRGHLDEDGFLTLVDRYSRFARIGGEMVGLAAVEAAIRPLLDSPDTEIMAVAIPDSRKGERIVLLHDRPLEVPRLRQRLLAGGYPPRMLPGAWLQVDVLPRLGSGKLDLATAREVAARRAPRGDELG